MPHKKTIPCLIFILLSLSANTEPVFSPIEDKEGNITFQPNVIPFLNVTDRPLDKPESFRFEWLGNSFDVELFFNATYKGAIRLFSLRDFEDDFDITVRYTTTRNESRVQFGWMIENVESISNLVHSAWFKIEDTQPFDYEDIDLREVEMLDMEKPYNITLYHLPDNLVLSFEDLLHKGFIVGYQNKTCTSVKGFSGKSSWNLDPVTYSGGIMTLYGYSEGSEGSFYDFWYASWINGWNVSSQTCENATTGIGHQDTQFVFDCRLQIGSAFQTTWFADENVSIVFTDGVITGAGQDCIYIYADSLGSTHFKLGNLVDSTNRITNHGCQLISLETTYNHEIIETAQNDYAFVELYDTMVQGKRDFFTRLFIGCDLKMYNCIFENTILNFPNIASAYPRLYRVNIEDEYWGLMPFADNYEYRDIVVHSCGSATYFAAANGGTITDAVLKNNTYVATANSISVDCYVVDLEADSWCFNWMGASSAEIYRQYEFDVRTIFLNQTSIANCNVSLTDTDGVEVFNVQTYANGSIATQTVTYAFYNQTGGDTPYLKSPHTLKVFKEGVRMYNSVFNITEKTDLTLTLTPRGWHTGTEGITFQPDSIPKVKTSYSDYTFYFTYEEYRLGLRPFAIYNDTLWTMKDIVPFLNSEGATYTWAFRKTKQIIHYGFNVTGIPEVISTNLNYLGFKVVEYNFPLSAIEKETFPKDDINVTILYIPRINLKFSFQDLQERGYTVQFINKTCLLIGNVNQTDLDIDPIVYSSPLITVTGFTRTNPCNFQYVCDVNDAQGWGVVDAVGLNEFVIEAFMQIGDGSTTTWFADEAVRVVFVSSSATLTPAIKTKYKAYLRLGRLLNNSTKTTDKGVTIEVRHETDAAFYYLIRQEIAAPELELYGSLFKGNSRYSNIYMYEDARIYGCIFDDCYLFSFDGSGVFDIYRTTIFNPSAPPALASYGLHKTFGTLDDVLLYSMYYAIYSEEAIGGTITNGVFKNTTYLAQCAALTANVILRNCESDNWNIFWFGTCTGELYCQYSFDLTVIHRNGDPANQANVTIINTYLGTSQSWLTNSTGQIPTQNYNYGHYNQSQPEIHNYNPYNVTVTLTGYETYTSLVNVTKRQDLLFCLTATAPEEAAPFRVDLLLFMTCLLFTCIYEYGTFTNRDLIWSGIICSICWIVLSLVWFILSGTVYVIALLFSGVGIFYIVRWMIDLLNNSRSSRSLGEEDDAFRSL